MTRHGPFTGTNRPEVVKFLVDKGADQKAKDDDELTAYDLAKVISPMPLHRGGAMYALTHSIGGCCCGARSKVATRRYSPF